MLFSSLLEIHKYVNLVPTVSFPMLVSSQVNLRAFLSTKQTLKSKGKVVSVTRITKRQRDPGSDESRLKKKTILTKQSQQPLRTRLRGSTVKDESHSELESLSGVKQKREEKRQRGISRSKKIRRSQPILSNRPWSFPFLTEPRPRPNDEVWDS